MQFLMTILYIILFIVSLSALIVVHELGHLAAAKAFKVYCFEYSIGFGPKLFSRKRKNGETYFSLRAIPFGGYVSMYGEGAEVPEGLEIPPERSLDNIKKWKKGIILVAGVTMNVILSLVIFFIANICFPNVQPVLNPITISETNALSDKSFSSGDGVDTSYIKIEGNQYYWHMLSDDCTVYKKDNTEVTNVSVMLDSMLSNLNDLDWSYFVKFAVIEETGKTETVDGSVAKEMKIVTDYSPSLEIDHYTFNIGLKHATGDKDNPFGDPVPTSVTLKTVLNEDGETYSVEKFGLSITKQQEWLGLKAFGKTFENFGESSAVIFKTLGSLFTSAEAREGIGGIISIGFESTNYLRNFGFQSYLRIWGMVSVNLAIVNLLPFPGLDGWQLLVLIIEGISKKKIPDKVKTIVSWVGLILLFGLMILLVIKDVIKYII